MRAARFAIAFVVAMAAVAAEAEPTSKDPVLQTVEFDGKAPVRLKSGDLDLVMDTVAAPENARAPRLTGSINGKPAFSMRLGDDPVGGGAAKLRVVQLDGKVPQIVFQHFTSGAHCCTETAIATSRDGANWTIINTPMLDGDSGYAFEDVDSDGDAELLSADNSFLYAFASYADSVPPTKIEKLKGDRLVDVTKDTKYREPIAKSLNDIEHEIGSNKESWHNNGFLAGWVATKAVLGQGPDAWTRMLNSYQRDTDWMMNVCQDPLPVEKCADDRMRAVGFPEALRTHLLTHGYITSVSDYPLPKGAK